MADPNMMNAVEEVERIIISRSGTLVEALQPSSTSHPQGENQAFLALAGQKILEDISWRKFLDYEQCERRHTGRS